LIFRSESTNNTNTQTTQTTQKHKQHKNTKTQTKMFSKSTFSFLALSGVTQALSLGKEDGKTQADYFQKNSLIAFKNKDGKYCNYKGAGNKVVCDKPSQSWDTLLQVVNSNGNRFRIKAPNGKFCGVGNDKFLTCQLGANDATWLTVATKDNGVGFGWCGGKNANKGNCGDLPKKFCNQKPNGAIRCGGKPQRWHSNLQSLVYTVDIIARPEEQVQGLKTQFKAEADKVVKKAEGTLTDVVKKAESALSVAEDALAADKKGLEQEQAALSKAQDALKASKAVAEGAKAGLAAVN